MKYLKQLFHTLWLPFILILAVRMIGGDKADACMMLIGVLLAKVERLTNNQR